MNLGRVFFAAFSILFVFFQPTSTTNTSKNLEDISNQILRKQHNVSVTVYDRGGLSEIKSLLAAFVALFTCSKNNRAMQSERKHCAINVNDLGLNVPLIINPDDHSEFLYPNKDGNIDFDEGQSVFLSCGTEGENNFTIFSNISYAEFFCACGELFYGNGHLVQFDKLTCQTYPQYLVIKYLHNYAKRKTHEIGFFVDESDTFLPIYSVLHLDDDMLTHYAKYTVPKSIGVGQNTYLISPPFTNTKLSDIIEALDESAQMESFKAATYRIDDPYPCNILEPAYLVSPHSMVYTAATVSAYDYLNVVPFWKCNVSHGNWEWIDMYIRDMATELQKDLTVHVGLFGTLQVDTVNQTRTDMYLSAKSVSNLIEKKFPVPMYAFKAVIDREGRSGVVFITVNDIHLKLDNFTYYCENPMTQKEGARMLYFWKPKLIGYGFSYVCSVADFQKNTKIYLHEDIEEDKLLYIPA